MIDQNREDRPRFPRDSRAAALNAPGHDEWLIDQSLAETFPASDPTSQIRPGSTVAMRYAAERPYRAGFPVAWAALGLSLLCAVVLLRRRR